MNTACVCTRVCVSSQRWFSINSLFVLADAGIFATTASFKVPAYGGPRTDTAYRVQNLTSWGGNILYDSHDGMYHLFVSRMGGGKGLSSWGGNSQIDHAVATDPMDQFKYTDTALKAEVRLRLPCVCQCPCGYAWACAGECRSMLRSGFRRC